MNDNRKKRSKKARKVARKRNPNFYLRYTEVMERKLQEGVFALEGISNARWTRSKNGSKYYLFKKNKIRFEISVSTSMENYFRMWSHWTYEYNFRLNSWWIDASLGRYTPKDVIDMIKLILELWNLYFSSKTIEELKRCAIENNVSYYGSDYREDGRYELAELFMNKYGISDDRFSLTKYVLELVSSLALCEIEEGEDDE